MSKLNRPQKSKPGKSGLRSLGPVPSLEQHLQPDWWQRIFNSMYLKTDGDVVEDQRITKKEIDIFSELLALKWMPKFWICAVAREDIH